MKGSNSDLGGCSCSEFDFGFAFNDSHFSDRVLRIEIIPDSCTRRLEEVLDLTAFHDEQVLNGNQIPVVRVKTLYISSVILAAKSPFFHKLFSNGMRESEQGHITLRINVSEEDALMELLSFIYTNTLNISAPPAVFHVLIAADKFVVPSCLRYCTNWLLRNSPMTTDFALMYLEHQLPHADSIIQPLFDAAKQYLLDRYKDLTEEVMGFPFSGLELVLASDHLQVDSEDFVCDFVLQWARQHYTKQNKARSLARSLVLARLAHLIRFPYMTCQKLKEVLTCDEFRPLVVEALIFKAKPLHLQRQQSLAAVELNHCRFVGRAYKHRPVKVVTLECATLLQRVVYWDLKKEECATLFPSGRLYSQAFHLSGQEFFLSVQCNMDEQEEGSFHCFGLFLGMKENSSVSLAVDYEFAARSKRKEEFVREYKDNYTFTGGEVVGKNLFAAMPWDYFITEDEDSLFFINGVLHLRAELTIKC